MLEEDKKRVALIGIIVQNPDSVASLNQLLHEYSDCIIGRMGIPCKDRSMNLISIAVDAEEDLVTALAGKIGMIPGISSKTVFPKTDNSN